MTKSQAEATLEQIAAGADTQQRQTMVRLAALENHVLACTEFRPSEMIEIVRLCTKLLNNVSSGDWAEFTEDFAEMNPAVVGQVILKNLPGNGSSIAPGWTAAEKSYWINVAEELGPDWIETFRSVGAFLKRVEGF